MEGSPKQSEGVRNLSLFIRFSYTNLARSVTIIKPTATSINGASASFFGLLFSSTALRISMPPAYCSTLARIEGLRRRRLRPRGLSCQRPRGGGRGEEKVLRPIRPGAEGGCGFIVQNHFCFGLVFGALLFRCLLGRWATRRPAAQKKC